MIWGYPYYPCMESIGTPRLWLMTGQGGVAPVAPVAPEAPEAPEAPPAVPSTQSGLGQPWLCGFQEQKAIFFWDSVGESNPWDPEPSILFGGHVQKFFK